MDKQRRAAQILGRADRHRFDQRRRRHGNKLAARQPMKRDPRPRLLTDMDRGIDTFAAEIDHARQARGEADRHLRVTFEEPTHARDEPAGAESRRHAQTQDAALATKGDRLFRRRRQPVEHVAHLLGIEEPGRGQTDPLAHALEEPHAKQFLEQRDLAADGALGARQFLAGARETQVTRSGLERHQRREWRNGAARATEIITFSHQFDD